MCSFKFLLNDAFKRKDFKSFDFCAAFLSYCKSMIKCVNADQIVDLVNKHKIVT